jgi:serine/threonine protein kinase, bacterial
MGRPLKRLTVAVAVIVALVGACTRPPPPPPATMTVTIATPAPPPAPRPVVVAPPLDGTYGLEFDDSKARGPIMWYGFRSLCTADGCTATGTVLGPGNREPAQASYGEPPYRPVFDWTGGQWQGGYSYINHCAVYLPLPTSPMDPWPPPDIYGKETRSVAMTLEPQPDGSYRGTDINTVTTNECGKQGTVNTTRYVATRFGPPPPGVVADPPTPTSTSTHPT